MSTWFTRVLRGTRLDEPPARKTLHWRMEEAPAPPEPPPATSGFEDTGGWLLSSMDLATGMEVVESTPEEDEPAA